MKKIAMLQPNYLPWKGVFDLIDQVDVFVFYDDVQYTKRDWRNRNKIRTNNGDIWLSVPVISSRGDLICDVKINNESDWQKKHYQTIKTNYSKAPHFDEYSYLIDDIYLNNKWDYLNDLDIFATKIIATALGIQCKWVKASDLNISGAKDGEKIIKICKKLECDYFINGPASKEFMNEELFKHENISLNYIEYSYPEYTQLQKPFNHYVSVLDLIFNCGSESIKLIRSRGML